MQKWEYLVSRIDLPVLGHDRLDNIKGWLNDLGQDGWEIVSVSAEPIEDELLEYTVFFKRPVVAKQSPEDLMAGFKAS
jgi:hypothetical protein